MGLSATIALADALLVDGRGRAAQAMLEPLAPHLVTATPDQAVAVGCMLARAHLFEHQAPDRAAVALQDAEPRAASALSKGRVALWKGWMQLVQNQSHLALAHFHAAALHLRGLPFVIDHNWLHAGFAEGYTAVGHTYLAAPHRAQAKTAQSVLRDAWLERVVPAPEHVLLAPPAIAPWLTTLAPTPLLITGAAGTGKRFWAKYLAETAWADAPLEIYDAGLDADGVRRALDTPSDAPLLLFGVDALSRSAQRALAQGAHPTRPVIATATTCPSELAVAGAWGAFQIGLPRLHERTSDVPLFVYHFLRTLQPGRKPFAAITDRALLALTRYDWPGNIRQLRNEIERVLVYLGSEPAALVDLPHLSPPIRQHTPFARTFTEQVGAMDLDQALAATEKSLIEGALAEHDGQISSTAAHLGLTRQGLYKKLKRLGINADRFHRTPRFVSLN